MSTVKALYPKELLASCQETAQVRASREETRQGVAYGLTRHQTICLYKEGLSPMDDVGGLSGLARFLNDVYEEEDRKESAALLRWAKSLGWNPNKKAITIIL